MRPSAAFVIGVVTLACGVSVHAAIGSNHIPRAQAGAELFAGTPTLRVEHVRLEPETATSVAPSSVLKFDLFNVSANKLTDMVLEISILERPDRDGGARRVLVRPFTVRAD